MWIIMCRSSHYKKNFTYYKINCKNQQFDSTVCINTSIVRSTRLRATSFHVFSDVSRHIKCPIITIITLTYWCQMPRRRTVQTIQLDFRDYDDVSQHFVYQYFVQLEILVNDNQVFKSIAPSLQFLGKYLSSITFINRRSIGKSITPNACFILYL